MYTSLLVSVLWSSLLGTLAGLVELSCVFFVLLCTVVGPIEEFWPSEGSLPVCRCVFLCRGGAQEEGSMLNASCIDNAA